MKNIKVFSDFACPFCYIGLAIVDRLKSDYPDLEIEWFPFELDPNTPMTGREMTDKIPIEQIEMAYRRITRLGSEYNLIFNNKTTTFNTNRLHKASIYAGTVGKYYEFSKEAFKFIFEYGENIALESVVNQIASSIDLDIDKMNRQIDEGIFDSYMKKSRKLIPAFNIESVPTFIINDEKQVTTLKEYKKIVQDILQD